MRIVDAFSSPQRGFQQLLPLFSLCYEGNDIASSFAVPEMSYSPLIRIAIWGRDTRIVVLTGSFFLANMAGLLFSKGFSVSRLATGVLILLFIALDKVNSPSPHPHSIYFRGADTRGYSDSGRMVSRFDRVSPQPHRQV